MSMEFPLSAADCNIIKQVMTVISAIHKTYCFFHVSDHFKQFSSFFFHHYIFFKKIIILTDWGYPPLPPPMENSMKIIIFFWNPSLRVRKNLF